jgi:hypothetical protein
MVIYGTLNASGSPVINLPAPSGASDATPKQYVDGHDMPVGGTTGQVLTKKSGTDYDTQWGTGVDEIKVQATDPGATSGLDMWYDTTSTPAQGLGLVPTGGLAQQVLVKNSGADYDTKWDVRGIPAFANIAARDATITAPVEGQICTVAGQRYVYQGGAWLIECVITTMTSVTKGIPGATGTIGNTAWATWTAAAVGFTLVRPGLVLARCQMDVQRNVGGGFFTARINGDGSTVDTTFENEVRGLCVPTMLGYFPAGASTLNLDVGVYAAAGFVVNSTAWGLMSTGGIS